MRLNSVEFRSKMAAPKSLETSGKTGQIRLNLVANGTTGKIRSNGSAKETRNFGSTVKYVRISVVNGGAKETRNFGSNMSKFGGKWSDGTMGEIRPNGGAK